jgi:protein-L-isoaspartate(D-aspartate) O-methyltransferase
VLDEYEDAAAQARATMVERLRGLGTGERTLAAFASVPRHRLVPHFWTLSMNIGGYRTQPSEYREGDTAALGSLHDPERALAINRVAGARGATTSTASAPRVLAAQADLLALEPGMRVLEIGTGPGYFAAILATLVGSAGHVTSIEIDGEIAEGAAARLDALGYHNVAVVVGDGHRGAPDSGRYDRVVGSVGCADVSAAWLRELADEGFALVPLVHGAMHPMVRVDPHGTGRIVSRSGYVSIQGAQAHTHLWPHALAAVPATEQAELGGAVAAAFVTTPDRARIGSLGEWDLAYWTALHDQRAGMFVELNDGAGSSARVDAGTATVAWGGPQGHVLSRALLDLAATWLAAGQPRAEDFAQAFVPAGTAPGGADLVIRRVDHDQIATLDPP